MQTYGDVMKRPIRERLSYANVMATIAVFIALGGTSYALTLPRDSVGSAQLRGTPSGSRRFAAARSDLQRSTIGLSDCGDVALRTRRSLRGEDPDRKALRA